MAARGGSSNEPLSCIKGGDFLISLVTLIFSRRTLLHGVGWLDLRNMT